MPHTLPRGPRMEETSRLLLPLTPPGWQLGLSPDHPHLHLLPTRGAKRKPTLHCLSFPRMSKIGVSPVPWQVQSYLAWAALKNGAVLPWQMWLSWLELCLLY